MTRRTRRRKVQERPSSTFGMAQGPTGEVFLSCVCLVTCIIEILPPWFCSDLGLVLPGGGGRVISRERVQYELDIPRSDQVSQDKPNTAVMLTTFPQSQRV
jgi:hypothetical protein